MRLVNWNSGRNALIEAPEQDHDTLGGHRLSTALRRVGRYSFAGYVVDDFELSRRFVVEIFADGVSVDLMLADQFDSELSKRRLGDGRYGFVFNLRPSLIGTTQILEVRVANLDVTVGEPIVLKDWEGQDDEDVVMGEVRWTGGLHLTGWVRDERADAPRVRVLIDDELVCECRADRWRHVDNPQPMAVRAFDIHLPAHLADGQVWRASVRRDDGRELSGSPVTLCAFDRGLEELLRKLGATPGQRLQGRLYDQLAPPSLPFSLYMVERSNFQPEVAPHVEIPIAVVLLDNEKLGTSTTSLEAQTHGNWTAGVIPTTIDPFCFDPVQLEEFVNKHARESQLFVFAAPGVAFTENALARFADFFHHNPEAPLAYADLELMRADGSLWPIALPAFDYERMLEQGYFAAAFAVHRTVVELAIGKSADNLFRVANIAFDDDHFGVTARHLPGPIARLDDACFSASQKALRSATSQHLAARGMDAAVSDVGGTIWPACKVARRFSQRPTVSILVPTRNHVDLLSTCLKSIYPEATRAKAEIIVIDNDSSDQATLRFLRDIDQEGVRVLRVPGPFNYARLNNIAAHEAQGDYLCFLDNAIEVREDLWLEEMLSRHVDERVGAVGAKLLWPSSIVKHGGVVLGTNFAATHTFRDRTSEDPGYTDLLRVAHSCSAVTAACMTTLRERFLTFGGFDEIAFPVNFSDIDYCLRLTSSGLGVVFTPHATLFHKESASRGKDDKPDSSLRFDRELRLLRSKWGSALLADPFYNPILALDDPPYSALAWSPRSLSPRTNAVAPPSSVPPGV